METVVFNPLTGSRLAVPYVTAFTLFKSGFQAQEAIGTELFSHGLVDIQIFHCIDEVFLVYMSILSTADFSCCN